MNEEQFGSDNYIIPQFVWLCFGWICEECKTTNYMSFNHWHIYNGVGECRKCEKAHQIPPPFK